MFSRARPRRRARCPFRAFYEMRVANGMLPAMARLTLARKMAAIALILWKKGETFAAEHLKLQAA